MSMSAGGGSAHAASEINVTPMIDVLLVLLIIFMVIVPVAPRGLDAVVPQMANGDASEAPATIVVSVTAQGVGEPIYRINKKIFAKREVEPRLAQIFAAREDKVMFVQADGGLEFSKVAEVVNMGHAANVASIGLLTKHADHGD